MSRRNRKPVQNFEKALGIPGWQKLDADFIRELQAEVNKINQDKGHGFLSYGCDCPCHRSF